MTEKVQLHDLSFEPFISQAQIEERIKSIAADLKTDFGDKRPIFLAILNGSFVFAADFVRQCDFDCELSFIKLASYDGLNSTGALQTMIGLTDDLTNRDVIILEDIVDTGNTIHQFIPTLLDAKPASITTVALLVKPDSLQHDIEIAHVAFEIPPKFVVGYGMDYKGLGRNLPAIYQLSA